MWSGTILFKSILHVSYVSCFVQVMIARLAFIVEDGFNNLDYPYIISHIRSSAYPMSHCTGDVVFFTDK